MGARDEFTRHLQICDRCGPIKLRFLAIRKIQREIKRRRYIVLHLHRSCSGKTTTTTDAAQWDQYTKPTTTSPWWTVHPKETIAPIRSIFGQGSAASTISAGIAMVVAVISVAVMLF